MPALGHGISAAVRMVVPEWMDPDTIAAARKVNPKLIPFNLRDAKNWQRINKRGARNGASTRTYRNNEEPSLLLEIRSNYNDTQITHFGLKVNGKYVTGGDCRVTSVNVAATAPDMARVQDTQTAVSPARASAPRFRRLSQSELNKLMVDAQHSDDAAFDRLFEEREV